jgi:hypothetical protein
MGKIHNVILNAINATNYITSNANNNNLSYNIDWSAILPNNKKYLLTFAYNASTNYINGYRFPYLYTNIIGSNVHNATSVGGAPVLPLLGTLEISMINYNSNFGSYTASPSDNPPVYLSNRPVNNTLNVQLLDNLYNSPFTDLYWTAAGTGTATQSGIVLTIVSNTTGLITIGTVITIGGIQRTVIAFGTCTGSNTGTLLVSVSATIAVATAYSFPAVVQGNPPAPYILTLSFEEIDD